MSKITNEQKQMIIEGIKECDIDYKDYNYGNSSIMIDNESIFCFVWENGYIYIDMLNNLIGFGWSFENAIQNGLDNESLDYLIEYITL